MNTGYDFELPPTLVDNEFQAIWRQVTSDLEQSKRSFEDEGTTEEKAKAEYQDIAARRVRLGLILSEVGTRNKIEVTDDEVNRALLERVRQFPGQERKVYDFYRNNPQALAEIRAPIFEDKVIDFIAELASVKEKPVTAEELYADPDDAGHHHHDHDDHDHHHHDHDHDHDHDHIMTMTTITIMATARRRDARNEACPERGTKVGGWGPLSLAPPAPYVVARAPMEPHEARPEVSIPPNP